MMERPATIIEIVKRLNEGEFLGDALARELVAYIAHVEEQRDQWQGDCLKLHEELKALEAERDHYKAVARQQANDNRSVDEALISLARKLNMPHPEVAAAVKVAAFAEARIAAQDATIAELTASREAIAARLVQAGVEIGTLTMRVEALEREGGAG